MLHRLLRAGVCLTDEGRCERDRSKRVIDGYAA
jgi:hypothetical protein